MPQQVVQADVANEFRAYGPPRMQHRLSEQRNIAASTARATESCHGKFRSSTGGIKPVTEKLINKQIMISKKTS